MLGLLALVGVAAVALTLNRTGAEPQAGRQLDEAAVAACEVFEPEAEQVLSGELQGRPLYRALQDVYNQAQRSQTEGFPQQVAELNSAAINGDDAGLRERAGALQRTCQQTGS